MYRQHTLTCFGIFDSDVTSSFELNRPKFIERHRIAAPQKWKPPKKQQHPRKSVRYQADAGVKSQNSLEKALVAGEISGDSTAMSDFGLIINQPGCDNPKDSTFMHLPITP